jgi:hypothetical protein
LLLMLSITFRVANDENKLLELKITLEPSNQTNFYISIISSVCILGQPN